MANAIYPLARQKFLEGLLDWAHDDIKACLVNTALYTYNGTHEFMDAVAASPDPRVGTDQLLSGKSTTGGTADAADITFPAVVGGTVSAVIIYKSTGALSTSVPIAYIDDVTGLPITPTGVDITVVWSDDANKIFTL